MMIMMKDLNKMKKKNEFIKVVDWEREKEKKIHSKPGLQGILNNNGCQ